MAPKKVKGPSKSQAIAALADMTEMKKSEITAVLDALEVLIGDNLRKSGEFTIHGLVKVHVAHKKATKARPGRNPATGEAITIKAKPACKVVRVRALKRLKDKI